MQILGGFLVHLEGIGGSGKSTLCAALQDALENDGWPVVRTREPGGTELGLGLREVLVVGRLNPSPLTEAFLFEADRAETYATVIRPALDEGQVVISDRGPFGTAAYQGHGRGIDINLIDAMSDAACGGRKSDLVIVIDIDPVVGLERKRLSRERDRFDEEDVPFQQRVREGFLGAATRFGSSAHVLDGQQTPEELLRQVLDLARSELRRRTTSTAVTPVPPATQAAPGELAETE